MELLSAEAIVFSKEIWKKFDPENMKKRPSKVAHNQSPNLFMNWPSCPTGQKQKSRTTKGPNPN